MDNQSKAASLVIAALLVVTPFLQISPAAAASLSDVRRLQKPSELSSFRAMINSQSSSSSSNQLIQAFETDWFNFGNLSSMWDRSIVDGFMTNQIKVLNASVTSSNLDSGTKNSLVAKLNAAFNKASTASGFILQGEPRQTDNMFHASDNVLNAFINQVQGLAGKKIPQSLATGFISSARSIIHGSTLRGSLVQPLISSSDLTIFNELLQETRSAEQAVKVDIQQLINAGFSVKVEFDEGCGIRSTLVVILAHPGLAILFVVGLLAGATLATLTVVNRMAAHGQPLSGTEIAGLFFVNLLIIGAATAGTICASAQLAAISTMVGAAMGIPVGVAIDPVIVDLYRSLSEFIHSTLPDVEQTLLRVRQTLSPTTTFVSSCGSPGTSTSCSLSSLSVGNVIVVLAEATSDSTSLTSVMSIFDGSDTFTKQAQIQESTGEPTVHKVIDVEIWTATTSLTGTQTISVTFTGGMIDVGTMQAVNLAGASPTPLFSATGSCASVPAGCSKTIATSSSNIFTVGRVAVATAIDIAGDGISAGSQYTMQTSGEGQAEFSTSVSSPTNYPFISTANPDAFVDVGAIF